MTHLALIQDVRCRLDEPTNRKANAKIFKFLSRNNSERYYFEDRDAKDPIKIRQDLACGKKGEFLAAAALAANYGFPAQEPDCTVRGTGEKGWGADLPNGPVPVHVKTSSSVTRAVAAEDSWTVQLANIKGVGGRDVALLDQVMSNELLAGMAIGDNSAVAFGILRFVLPVVYVPHYTRAPKKKDLIGFKLALYYSDLFADAGMLTTAPTPVNCVMEIDPADTTAKWFDFRLPCTEVIHGDVVRLPAMGKFRLKTAVPCVPRRSIRWARARPVRRPNREPSSKWLLELSLE